MASSEADIQAQIDRIDSAIQDVLTTPFADLTKYSIGGMSVDKVATLKELREYRKELIAERDAIPYEEIRVFLEPGDLGSREDLNPY